MNNNRTRNNILCCPAVSTWSDILDCKSREMNTSSLRLLIFWLITFLQFHCFTALFRFQKSTILFLITRASWAYLIHEHMNSMVVYDHVLVTSYKLLISPKCHHGWFSECLMETAPIHRGADQDGKHYHYFAVIYPARWLDYWIRVYCAAYNAM